MSICDVIAYAFSDYSEPWFPPTPITKMLREHWQSDREIKSLRYLWKHIEPVIRMIHWITRRSDPRWSKGRWKAKT